MKKILFTRIEIDKYMVEYKSDEGFCIRIFKAAEAQLIKDGVLQNMLMHHYLFNVQSNIEIIILNPKKDSILNFNSTFKYL